MARQSPSSIVRLGIAVCVVQWLAVASVAAQPVPAPADTAAAPVRDPRGPSADGYYWVEVEVSIFSSVYGGTPYSEIPVPDSNNLRYLPQLRPLVDPADAYAFPFVTAAVPETPAAPVIDPATGVAALPPPVLEGPEFSPAVPGAFKLPDVERDAYVALDRRFWRFNQLNSRLQSGAEHAVLWHQVWRQPLLPRAQTPALLVIGGDAFGNHNVLEGSIRLSSQGQGLVADLDANLWLSAFADQLPAAADGEWKLPEQPVLDEPADNAPAVPAQGGEDTGQVGLMPAVSWYPTSIWQLNQSRDVGPNALYYLDHPAMGLLIEIRPYLVPEPLVPATDTTAIPAAAAFE